MKEFILPCGSVVIIDDCDFDSISVVKWHLNKDGYAQRQPNRERVRKTLLMHRMIMGASPVQCIDHVNGNRIDNRRENLRFATRSQNQWNRGKTKVNKTGFKRVFYHGPQRKRPYTTSIGVFGKIIFLGSFETAEEAYAVYVEAAKKHHGDFARV